ncbi:MAG: DUF397 domain-containing protein, partial [Pseudonocardiaceae bacterium]
AALTDGGRAIRDSKDRSGPVLKLKPPAWTAFTTWISVDKAN